MNTWFLNPGLVRFVARFRTRTWSANGQFRREIALFLAVALGSFATTGQAEAIKVGDTFPDPGEFSLEGKLPADWKGKVVLVDFWASWCLPCKISFPALNELHRQYAAKGLVVLAINVDEKRTDMESFLKKVPAEFAVLRDARQKLVEAAGVETMPTSFLIDATGKVRFLHNGYRGDETKKEYVRQIEELLKTTAKIK